MFIATNNRLARIAEGPYFINHRYEMDLETILNRAPGAIKETQS